MSGTKTRIESMLDVQAYLQNLCYALDHGAVVTFQKERQVDNDRDNRFTNNYTVNDLFPNENPVEVLRKELRTLTVNDYIRTVKDTRFKNRTEMREFGKVYKGNRDVYIKIRVELLSSFGNHTVFIMSFHYAVTPFTDNTFPYRKK